VADYGFQLLRERLKKDLQFNAPCYEEKHLKRRLAVRMRALNIDHYDDYLHFLNTQKEEYKKLFNALTINVTEFFRDASTFEALRRDVFPRMIKAKAEKGRKLIRIWSTGCSDGKEPYSIAILLYDVLGEEITEFSPMIFASDIDDAMLRKAEKGEYLKEDVEGIREEYLQKYFQKTAQGYRVVDDLRSMVKFEHRDLISDRMHSSLDMIICRNVVIYFSRETKEKIYMDFYNALQEGGFLLLGKTETLFGEARNKFKTFNNIERIYVK
jgi:chemotaxis protein methyltransferase CheR